MFAILPQDLAPSTTFGVLIRRNENDSKGRLRWAAIVDCRGEKALRRFFTLWHEIAHYLTAVEQYELPLHRASIHAAAKDPIEKITDLVAGDFAFFEPLFGPVFEQELRCSGRLTYDGIERIRASYCAEASFQSTLLACINRCPIPVMWVEAELAFKKAEREALNSFQVEMFPTMAPKAVLRVTETIRNDAAKSSGLLIPKNMRVPETSVISKAFLDGLHSQAHENLGDWCSQGRPLAAMRLFVEARRSRSGVCALVSAVDDA